MVDQNHWHDDVSIPYRQCLSEKGDTITHGWVSEFQFLIGNVLA